MIKLYTITTAKINMSFEPHYINNFILITCVLLFIYTFIYMLVEILCRMVLPTKRFNSKVEPDELSRIHRGYSSTHNYNLRSRRSG